MPLDLVGVDVVLGMLWLHTLGETRVNWTTLTITIERKEGDVILRCDPSLTKTKVSLKRMMKTWDETDQGYLVEFKALKALVDSAEFATLTPIQNTPKSTVQLIEQYEDIFQVPDKLPPNREIYHQIHLKEGAQPVNVRPYRYPQVQKNEIEKLVSEMLLVGIIQPIVSPFSSPVLLVKKKDGGWRFCVDYRALNNVTIPDKFPIPVVELLDELHGSKIYSKINLKSGYHQIRVHQDDIKKTTFRTHEGHYEFLVRPFGLTNAPSTFQALMNNIFKPHLRKFILFFFYDILICNMSYEDHLRHLTVVFDILRKNQLRANMNKCQFVQTRIEYLGHLISSQGVEADPEKVRAMMEWPQPQNIRELRGFLGLTSYYRRFVCNYGKIATPLTQLLKTEAFEWGAASQAFEQLKKAMITLHVWALSDFSHPFVVETDASATGLGTVLSQNKRPIAYFSHTLSERAQQKSIYERELMVVVLAVQRWRPYLLGQKFLVRTNQRALKFLLEQRVIQPQYQRWLSKLLGYDFEVQYRLGPENKVADGLSRVTPVVHLAALQVPPILNVETVSKEVAQDDKLLGIINQLKEDPDSVPKFEWIQGKLLYKKRLVLAKNSSLIPSVLHTFHDSVMGGHLGFLRTYKRLRGELYWEGMKNDVKNYVAACLICQKNKSLAASPAGLL